MYTCKYLSLHLCSFLASATHRHRCVFHRQMRRAPWRWQHTPRTHTDRPCGCDEPIVSKWQASWTVPWGTPTAARLGLAHLAAQWICPSHLASPRLPCHAAQPKGNLPPNVGQSQKKPWFSEKRSLSVTQKSFCCWMKGQTETRNKPTCKLSTHFSWHIQITQIRHKNMMLHYKNCWGTAQGLWQRVVCV